MASASAPATGMAVPPQEASTPEAVGPSAGAADLEDLVLGAAAVAATSAAVPPVGDDGSGGAASAAATGFLPVKAERTKVNVAEQHGSRTSVVWRFFAKFSPALDDGKNAKCMLRRDDGTECKAVYKHDNEANTGTGSMVRHLRRSQDESHKQAIKEFDAESKNSGAAKGARGTALGGAGKGECLQSACEECFSGGGAYTLDTPACTAMVLIARAEYCTIRTHHHDHSGGQDTKKKTGFVSPSAHSSTIRCLIILVTIELSYDIDLLVI